MIVQDVLGWEHESDPTTWVRLDQYGRKNLVWHTVSNKPAYTVVRDGVAIESRIGEVKSIYRDDIRDLTILDMGEYAVVYGIVQRKHPLSQLTRDFADSVYSLYSDANIFIDTRTLFTVDKSGRIYFFGDEVISWGKVGGFFNVWCEGDIKYSIILRNEGKSFIKKSYYDQENPERFKIKDLIETLKEYIDKFYRSN